MFESSRRSFLQLASLAAASTAVPSAWAGTTPAPIGVQLYTVHKEVTDDLPGTLAAIRKIGYTMVESFAPMHTRPAKELRKMVEDAGLTIPSGHFSYDGLEAQIDYAHELGVSYMVCSMLPRTMWTHDGFVQAAAEFNKVGALANQAKMRLCFHNHSYEFMPLPAAVGGTPDPNDCGVKILLGQTDTAMLGWEEDCYWVAQGGQDPLAFLQKNSARINLLHLKDRKAGATPTTSIQMKGQQFFTEIGNGTIDWAPILKIARSTGKLMFVEQDTTEGPALDSLAVSYKNLQKYLG